MGSQQTQHTSVLYCQTENNKERIDLTLHYAFYTGLAIEVPRKTTVTDIMRMVIDLSTMQHINVNIAPDLLGHNVPHGISVLIAIPPLRIRCI